MNKKAKAIYIVEVLIGLMLLFHPFTVYAQEQSEDEVTGACTFYDYVVAPYDTRGWGRDSNYPKQSINTKENYANDGREKLTVGTKSQNFTVNQYDCFVGGLNVNTCIFYNGGNPVIEGVTYQNSLSCPGIISHLSGEHLEDVVFNVDEPGLFGKDACIGKTVYTEYKLRFNKQQRENHSATYTLTDVVAPSGKQYDVQQEFFPLDDAPSNVLDKGYGKIHNYYFGMRYDVNFSLNEYTDDLLYTFLGDDDVWVFLDGTLVLDLGGIHASCGATVDLWQVGPIADAYKQTADKSLLDGMKQHTLTVLYMERGGNESNCHMQFTLPDSATIRTHDMTLDKQVHLTDWEQRTYEINLDVQNVDTQAQDAVVCDYIDSRFQLLDENGFVITPERIQEEEIYIEGGTVCIDEDTGLEYVKWNLVSTDSNWRKSIHIQAKDCFIGGNDVATNDVRSGVEIEGTLYPFEQPHVNVRLGLQLSDAQDVYFAGEIAQSLLKKQQVMYTNSYTIGEDGNPLKKEDVELFWYENQQAMDIGNPLSKMQILNERDASEQEYYLTANYIPLTQVDEQDSCTRNSEGHIAKNMAATADKRSYAIYTVRVVTGELAITNIVDETFGKIPMIRSNQTHIFQINQYAVQTDEQGNECIGDLAAVFYVPIAFDANGQITKGTEYVKNLSRGFYTVTEEESWTQEYSNKNTFGVYNIQDNDTDNDSEVREGVALFIGKRSNQDEECPFFYGLDTQRYAQYANGVGAKVQFYHRKIRNTAGIMDSASAYSIFCTQK